MTIMKILFISIICLLHIFIYFALFRNLSFEPLLRHTGKILLIINFSFVVIYFLLYRSHLDSRIYTILSSSIGIFWILVCTSVVLLIVFLSIRIGFGAVVLSKSLHYISFVSLIIAIILIAFSFYQNRILNFPTQKILIDNLQEKLKIILVADLHIDTLMNAKEIKKIVEKINSHTPDIIILAGDIVDSPFLDKSNIVKHAVIQLQKLRAKYGIYYSLGNHEYFYDYKNLVHFLSSSNIRVLQNENIFIDEVKINIAGVNDLITLRMGGGEEKMDLSKALSGLKNGYPTLLIAHQPKIVNYLSQKDTKRIQYALNLSYSKNHASKDVEHRDDFVDLEKLQNHTQDYKKVDLVLSGHTHGGQLFPFNFLVYLDQPFLKGLHSFNIDDKTSQIFITQGAGWWAMPMRLVSSREVNILELEKSV